MEVLKLEDILASKKATEEEKEEENDENDRSDDSETEISTKKENGQKVVKGRRISGRIWKDPRKRANSIIKTGGIRLSKDKKDHLRLELKRVKEHSKAIKDEKLREKEEKHRRRQANLKRQEENSRKSEVVQVIRNTAKLKRMKKKHLRKIEKRDITEVKK